MGTTDYTGTLTAHATITLPDDAEYAAAGIASFNTPLEELKDLANIGETVWRGQHLGYATYGSPGVSFDNHLNSIVAHTVQSGSGGVNANIQVPLSQHGDEFIVTCSLGYSIVTTATAFRIRAEYDDGAGGTASEIIHQVQAVATTGIGDQRPITLTGGLFLDQSGGVSTVTNVEFTLEVVNVDAGAGVGVYLWGELGWTLHRARWEATI